ncbi:hypothetical protein BY458DRAFT_194057 [Sporodiniella umbellata]|nr:hypothetical protein BY458DRAFT_194057 [Sporodiniella umbellata]
MDGVCREQCSPSLKSPCACRSSPSRRACRAIRTDIFNYHPENATAQTYASCSYAMQMNQTLISTWLTPNDPILWNVCPTPVDILFPLSASWVIAYLSAHLGFLTLWSLWLLYKFMREKNHSKTQHHPSLSDEMIEKIIENQVDSNSEWIQTGYRKDWIGNFMIFYMTCLSIFWMIVLLVLSLDYYGYVSSVFCQVVYLTLALFLGQRDSFWLVL